MERRRFVGVGLAGLVTLPRAARAQPSRRTPRIGFLNNLNPALGAPSAEAFLQGLRERGWVDGRNVTIVYRWADGDMSRHAALASELAKVPVDVIVTAGTQAVRAALQATKTIPIVVAIMPDPVPLGFAASLARPGGTVTGLANLFEEITPKQLQVFREVVPGAKRIALLSDRSVGDRIRVATESAARALGIDSLTLSVKESRDLETAMKSARSGRADGVLVLPSPFLNRYRVRIATLAIAHRLPTISESAEYVADGGLLSYGPNFPQMYFRAAAYVDRILRGEKPGDLPIERPTTFELVVNQQTAKALGIVIPNALLQRADRVIR
jgi:putative ABC transport system substrate-binding protein